MGIGYDTAWFLINCSKSVSDEVDFSRTITLGRQYFLLSRRECEKLFNNILPLSKTQKTQFYKDLGNSTTHRFPEFKYSEPFFKLLQNDTDIIADSLDYSDYEEATKIYDITAPISCELKNKYTCVFDGGLLEHVFNYPVALKNAMDMVAVGGHLILATPGNNCFGHGFYQFSPEVFYSILREENGFVNTQVYINKSNKWYLVPNPRLIHKRVECSPKMA